MLLSQIRAFPGMGSRARVPFSGQRYQCIQISRSLPWFSSRKWVPWDPNRWLRNQGRGDEGADGPHFRQTTPTTTTRTSRSRCPPSRPPGAPLRGRGTARLHGPRPAEWTSRPALQSRATTLAARAPPSPTTRTTTQVRVRPPGLALLRSRHLRSSRLFCMPSRLAA